MRIKSNTSLRRRIAVLLLAFVLLASLVAVAISWTLSVQQQDALVISLASRQTFLIENMVSEALEIDEGLEDQPRHIAALQESADIFEKTLWALINGGQVPHLQGGLADLHATQEPGIVAQLHRIHHTWDVFHGYVHVLVAENPDRAEFSAAAQAMQRLSPQLIQETDEATRLFEAAALQKNTRIWWIQGIFFSSALLLLGVGYLVAQKYVLNPLRVLSSIVERISWGDLNTPIEVTGPREIEAMAHSLDTLQAQLKNSRAELIKRAENLELNVAQRTRELEAAFQVSQDTVASLELDNLLSSVTDRAMALTQSQASVLCLLDPRGEYLAPVAVSGEMDFQPGSRLSDELRLDTSVDRQENTPLSQLPCANCPVMKAYGPGQCHTSPLRVGEQTLGVLCVCRTAQKRFDRDEMRALRLLSNSAAVAIANVHLLESAQRHAEQAAVLVERDHLAADLHDHLAQTLSFLNVKAESLKSLLAADAHTEAEMELEQVQSALASAHTELRATLLRLRRPLATTESSSQAVVGRATAGHSLVEELRTYVTGLEETYGFPIGLTINYPEGLVVSHKAQNQALHIVREALTNAWRHAQAQHVHVLAEWVPEHDAVCFTVQDDGRGFDPDNVKGDNHLGLMIMRSRAERCGGELVIDSTPNVGTKVIARFPVNMNSNRP